jgi:hypothetical protein
MWCNGGWRERLGGDVPFEFICEVARARALAEAGHVEGGAAAARHFCSGGLGERGDVAVVGDGCRGRGGRWWSREREREWNVKTEVEWPERAAGLLQAQPLSEPRARQEPRLLKSRANIFPGYLYLARVFNGAVE